MDLNLSWISQKQELNPNHRGVMEYNISTASLFEYMGIIRKGKEGREA